MSCQKLGWGSKNGKVAHAWRQYSKRSFLPCISEKEKNVEKAEEIVRDFTCASFSERLECMMILETSIGTQPQFNPLFLLATDQPICQCQCFTVPSDSTAEVKVSIDFNNSDQWLTANTLRRSFSSTASHSSTYCTKPSTAGMTIARSGDQHLLPTFFVFLFAVEIALNLASAVVILVFWGAVCFVDIHISLESCPVAPGSDSIHIPGIIDACWSPWYESLTVAKKVIADLEM